MYYEPNLYRMATCEQCGNRFLDDCGDIFCSSRCEREWDKEHAACENCGDEVGEDNLDMNGNCEPCAEKLEDEE